MSVKISFPNKLAFPGLRVWTWTYHWGSHHLPHLLTWSFSNKPNKCINIGWKHNFIFPVHFSRKVFYLPGITQPLTEALSDRITLEGTFPRIYKSLTHHTCVWAQHLAILIYLIALIISCLTTPWPILVKSTKVLINNIRNTYCIGF